MSESKSSLLAAAIAHRNELAAFFGRRVNCPATAADITQDLFLRLMNVSNIAEIANPRAYLFRAAANLLTDYRRSEGRRISQAQADTILDIADERPGPEATVAARHDLEMVRRAIAELPERQREIFRMSRLERVSHSEIARRFGVTTRTVENEIARALRYFAAKLKKTD